MKNGYKPILISCSNYKDSRGNMSILEDTCLPFKVRRYFWICHAPENTIRGGHAHKSSKQLLICLNGCIEVHLEGLSGNQQRFKLESEQNKLLYLPPLYWGSFCFKNNAMAFCMASDPFDEADYIRDYREFEKLKHAYQHR